MERFNVAPQAMFAKQRRGRGEMIRKENTTRKSWGFDARRFPRILADPFFLSTTTDFLRVVSQVPAC